MGSGELERIRWLRRLTARARAKPAGGRAVLSIGDDAALWMPPRGHAVVLTVDAQVEGVHFRAGWLRPREIGARAVATSASDLAAMAARPGGVLLSLTLPAGMGDRAFRDLYRGALEECRRRGLALLGGNLSAGPLAVTVTAFGAVRPGSEVRRDGARPGDGIYVTGYPGRSRIGRALLEGRRPAARGGASSACARAFRAPVPRIEEALYLVRALPPRAMIDLSDGLAQDLHHLLEEGGRRRGGGPGASIRLEALEALLEVEECAGLARRLGLDPRQAALGGGEDYELLLTAPAGKVERLAAAFERKFGLPLTCIGRIEASPGLRDGATGRTLSCAGFSHWARRRRGR